MMYRNEGENAPRADSGFSLVELVVAVFILAIGVLGMASTTVFITRQITLAGANTARITAIQSVMERVQATPYDSISSGQDTVGPIVVSWRVASTGSDTKTIEVRTVGPGLVSISAGQATPIMSRSVADTFTYNLLRP